MLVELNELDLLNRLANFEDHFVERKTFADQKDWVKTVVAFANSAPVGYPCVLYIGAKDNGEIEQPQKDLDSAQRTLTQKLKAVYPPPPYLAKVIERNGLQALAVIVLGSELRPHFAGPAYVRKGSQSFEASEEQFGELIAIRNSKARKLLDWKSKEVTVVSVYKYVDRRDERPDVRQQVVDNCNQFWLTLRTVPAGVYSYPLSQVELNFDHDKNRLKVEIVKLG